MSWLDSIGDFIGDNSSWLKPIAQAGISVFNNSQKSNAQSQYIDYLKQREDQNYKNQLDAYNAQLAASQASAANSAARASAARATEANRQKAAKAANDVSQKTYAELIKMYKPFTDTATALLPQKTKTYQDSLALQGMLQAYLNTPEELAKMNQGKAAFNVNIPLPQGVG